jgi:hypothetical protein
MQNYPAHATPTFMNGVFRLRSKICLRRMEIRVIVIGAQSNAVLAADLFNNLRVALRSTGVSYLDASNSYLTGVSTGTNLTNTQNVYFDKNWTLPSQAYDTTITTPTPQVRSWEAYCQPNLMLDVLSTTASGTGATWDTDGMNLELEYVSDSSVAPHPTLEGTLRFFIEYC